MKNSQKNLNAWAEKMTKDIYAEYKKNYSDNREPDSICWKYGIKVFYGPVKPNPLLMIISFQPGGDEEDYAKEDKKNFENGIFVPPPDNAYCENKHKMCGKIQSLTDYMNKPNILKESVVFPLIFFRAPSEEEFGKKMGNRRSDAEKFCFDKVREMLTEIQPKNILVLGIGTYQLMKKKKNGILGSMMIEEGQPIQRLLRPRHRLAILSETPKCKIFTSIHLTGARPPLSEEEETLLKEKFSQWISKNK